MPKKTNASSKKRKRIKKKKRDRFVINAMMISGAAILIIIAANITQGLSGEKDKFPENFAEDVLLSENTQNAMEKYDENDTLCRFDFIDVGQGDSALITTPGNEYILVDTGPSAGKANLLGHLYDMGVDEIDYLIISHPHNDHIGGAEKVLEEYKVNCIIMPEVISNTSQFEKLYEAIISEKEDGCKVYTAVPGDRYEIDDCTIKIIGPVEINEDELNNCSTAFTFSYGGFDALFAGDTEKRVEKLILSSTAEVDCELYKVSHHGSETSSSDEFINALSPEVSVISCAKDNAHGHPNTEVVQRLYDSGSAVYITSELGTITVLTDGDGYSVHADI